MSPCMVYIAEILLITEEILYTVYLYKAYPLFKLRTRIAISRCLGRSSRQRY